MLDKIPRIGTRGSPLALAQANLVRSELSAAHPDMAPPEVKIIRTTGDRIQDRPLAEVGGKGLFTKEIEDALLVGTIDVAVHSMKDAQTRLPDGLVIDCILPREDVRDAFFAREVDRLADLPAGSAVGTSSLRRAAQILARRPDVRIAPLRGNVATRLDKLAAGEVDATLLAVAGLKRLGEEGRIKAYLSPEEMLPAVAQGAIGVERRADDDRTAELLAPLNHQESATRVAAERALLAGLDGSCRTPIAGLACIDGDRLTLTALVAMPDGSAQHYTSEEGAASEAVQIGQFAADRLRDMAGPAFFETLT